MAEKILATPQTMSGAAVRPHISFQMSEHTWAGLKALATTRAQGQAEPADHAPVRIEPVTLDDGTPVPLSEVARALCDCELTRVVMNAEGAVLDLGRTQRTYTGAQRRAVITRDRACAWNDCTAQPRWCEVHHIRWWDRDTGPTSIDNAALLCTYHHHETHRRDLTLTRINRPPGDTAVRYHFHDPQGRLVSSPQSQA
jgi:hypothetical protein